MEKTLINIIEVINSFFGMVKTAGIITEFSLQCEFPDTNEAAYGAKFKFHIEELIIKLTSIKDDVTSNYRNGEVCHYTKLHPLATPETPRVDPKLVQICVTRKEIDRRLKAFMTRKRKDIDDRNIQEFCSRNVIDSNDPRWETQKICARVDAVSMLRYGSKSHAKISHVINKFGPQTRVLEEMPPTTRKMATNCNSVEERLRNMESHLKLKSEISPDNYVFGRLKQLEDRILYLESISPEYFNSVSKPNSAQNHRHKTELEKKYDVKK